MEKKIKAFVSYRMPGEKDFQSIGSYGDVHIHDKVDMTRTDTFFVSSFDKKVIFDIPTDTKKTNEFFSCDMELNNTPKEIKRTSYLHQIELFKKKIKKGLFSKIVLSRTKHQDTPENFDPYQLFNTLCTAYPNAFVYLFYSELSGLWIGATPEFLIQKVGDSFKTVALAGTKLTTENWTDKEKEEQQYVTNYIRDLIEDKSKSIKVHKIKDHLIGNIKHLKTEIDFELYFNDEINALTNKLQPTPAVCGVPQDVTMDTIKRTESHARSFYTGIIGPVGINNETELFVNLRCMQVCKNKLVFYAGGGITEDSNAKDEWQETERKIEILSRYII